MMLTDISKRRDHLPPPKENAARVTERRKSDRVRPGDLSATTTTVEESRHSGKPSYVDIEEYVRKQMMGRGCGLTPTEKDLVGIFLEGYKEGRLYSDLRQIEIAERLGKNRPQINKAIKDLKGKNVLWNGEHGKGNRHWNYLNPNCTAWSRTTRARLASQSKEPIDPEQLDALGRNDPDSAEIFVLGAIETIRSQNYPSIKEPGYPRKRTFRRKKFIKNVTAPELPILTTKPETKEVMKNITTVWPWEEAGPCRFMGGCSELVSGVPHICAAHKLAMFHSQVGRMLAGYLDEAETRLKGILQEAREKLGGQFEQRYQKLKAKLLASYQKHNSMKTPRSIDTVYTGNNNTRSPLEADEQVSIPPEINTRLQALLGANDFSKNEEQIHTRYREWPEAFLIALYKVEAQKKSNPDYATAGWFRILELSINQRQAELSRKGGAPRKGGAR